jgi:serine/threonine protein kinase
VLVPRQHLALRGLFIIDPNGVLQYQVVHNLSVGRRSEEVLRVLDGLQTGGLCPEGWTPEGATLDATRVLGPNSVVGQYQIEAKLGEGSFGSVFRAVDLTLRRTVALKVARPGDPELAAAVLAEARAAAAISHPNVCTVYSVDGEDGVSMIVMEYVNGQTLGTLLESGPMLADQAAAVIRQAALGMAAAHAHGVVHGDLKPANIMLTDDGLAKIMDFGLARRATQVFSATAETGDWGPAHSSAGLSGTPSYMAPEQARGESPTAASDVFSLGLVLFELLTGKRALAGDNILQVLRRIDSFDPDQKAEEAPAAFRPLLRQILTREPSARMRMTDLAAGLNELVAVQPI